MARRRNVAHVLLADSDLASRLALITLLSTAGYAVDGAANVSEATTQLDSNEYQLVLADLRTESADSGAKLLAYARQKEFHPATALISSRLTEEDTAALTDTSGEHLVSMTQENVSELLSQVADLIGDRADRKIRRSVRRAR